MLLLSRYSAAASLADGSMYNAGQSCCAVERIYVHSKIYDKFVEEFTKEVKKFKLGDPLDPATYIGPLTRGRHIDFLENQINDAKTKGGYLLTGGARVQRPGFYFEPTVIANCTQNMAMVRFVF
jgi:acyl-CoA reductase-like NAD-dependent aldehyde dehydrogenase